MRTNTAGMALIREFEGCDLNAYQDQEGRWTIGWGRARGIKAGDSCTQAEADLWQLEDVAEFERLLCNCLPGVRLNDNQFSALVSFCYNVGLGSPKKDGFMVLKNGETSTLRKCLLKGDFTGAAAEFLKWDKVGGKPSAGIRRRRQAEQALFLQAATP